MVGLRGVTVLMDYVLNEGVEPLLDNLVARARVNAVCCNPTVTAPAPEGQGSFQPPDDAGASVRLFDRPLWGRRSLWVKGAPSYHPDPACYRDSPYRPRRATVLTDEHGDQVDAFLAAAQARGLRVYFQLAAAAPPGITVDDLPRLPDGALPEGRMANVGCLASAGIRAYNRAYAADLARRYPTLDGVRVDWPEYPCYTLPETFCDFSAQVQDWGRAHGHDVAALGEAVGELWRRLHGELTNQHLEEILASGQSGPAAVSAALIEPADGAAWLQLKAALATDLLADWRDALPAHWELSANAFPPGYAALTGLDYSQVGGPAQAVSAKLYTMHWSLMMEFWGRRLMAHNPGLDEALLTAALARVMDIGAPRPGATLADYGYPGPDQPHPIGDEPQRRKLAEAAAALAGAAPLHALVHGYGPLADFARRMRLVADSAADGFWVNRYGYLSDEKLDLIGQVRLAGEAD